MAELRALMLPLFCVTLFIGSTVTQYACAVTRQVPAASPTSFVVPPLPPMVFQHPPSQPVTDKFGLNCMEYGAKSESAVLPICECTTIPVCECTLPLKCEREVETKTIPVDYTIQMNPEDLVRCIQDLKNECSPPPTPVINHTTYVSIIPQGVLPCYQSQQIMPTTILQPNIVPASIFPSNLMPQNMMSQNIMPQNMMLQDIMSQNLMSQNIMSQNSMNQNIGQPSTVVQLPPPPPDCTSAHTTGEEHRIGPSHSPMVIQSVYIGKKKKNDDRGIGGESKTSKYNIFSDEDDEDRGKPWHSRKQKRKCRKRKNCRCKDHDDDDDDDDNSSFDSHEDFDDEY